MTELGSDLAANGYRLDVNDRDGQVRLVLYKNVGDAKKILGHLTLRTADVYTFGTEILHKYDILEGLSQ